LISSNNYILLVIHYDGYEKDYPTETKKFTGSSAGRTNIVEKVKKEGESINLIQYALKKPTSLESESKALGCSALYSCNNEDKVIDIMSEIIKEKYYNRKSKPRWLGGYELYLLSLQIEFPSEEAYYVIRTTGGTKYKEILKKVQRIDFFDLLEIHETRSVLHTGSKRIIRSIVGSVMFVKTKESSLKALSEELGKGVEIDVFKVEKIVDDST